MTADDQAPAGATDPKQTEDPQAIREDIEQTREELGETVEALAAKADVKAQAKARVDEGREQVAQAAAGARAKARDQRIPLVAGAVALLAILLILARRG